jgi:ankyrin repeat protein
VQVLEVLLDAGAEVDAKADMYGGSTTVGLVATSIHPQNAGVQADLIDVLIAHGAHIDQPGAGGGTSNLINSCLANGRPGAAEYLARRGAPIDLEGAAGLGRLDLVEQFFDGDGQLANGATATQMKDGFSWACEYGRTEVVEFLLTRGMDVAARLRPHQQTGLHWAAMGPHVETVRLLLRSGSPIDVRDETFGVTALEWALYGWGVEKRRDERGAFYEVVRMLTKAGAAVDREWLASSWSAPIRERLQSDARMQTALAGP